MMIGLELWPVNVEGLGLGKGAYLEGGSTSQSQAA